MIRTKFKSSLSCSLIATEFSSCPGLSRASTTTMLVCTVQDFLVELGIDVLIEKVVASSPGEYTFNKISQEEGLDALALMRRRMIDKTSFLLCDCASKGIHYATKIVSFWYVDRVLTFILDSNASIGDNVNTAQDADVSLKKIDPLPYIS